MIHHLKRAFGILPPETKKKRFALVFLFILVSSWLEALGVGAIFPLVKVIADPASIHSVPMLARLDEFLGKPGDTAFLQVLTIGVLFVFVAKNAFYLFMTNYNLRVVKSSEAALCEELLLGYLSAPWSSHVERNSGTLLHSIVIAPRQIHINVIWPTLEVSVEVLTLVAIGALLFAADPVMTVAATGFVGIAMGVFLKTIPPQMSTLGEESVRIGKSSMIAIQQALGSAKEAKVLGRELFFWKVFAVEARRRAAVERRQKFLQSVSRPVAETVLLAGMLTAILIVLSGERSGTDIVATLSLFAVAAIRLLTSFNRLATGIATIRNSLPILDEVYDDVMTYRTGRRRTEQLFEEAAVIFSRELVLDGIGFTYPGRSEPTIRKLDLTIRHGESVALVGRSGAGKTTLADIVLGLLEPDGGRILIDGDDVTGRRAWRRNLFGYVPQSIYLIDDSLRANIAFGVPPEDIDERALDEAVRLACVQDLVARLPEGLDTVVGEGGVKLSGGERQRLGIARALYHKPEFIVFDEATSALDNVTEREFTRALDELRGTRTVIFIAHRLSTIEHCDKVVFLGNGGFVAEGTYAELIETCEPFRRIAMANKEDLLADD